MSHLNSSWFARAKEANDFGMDHLYDYGILFIKEYAKSFVNERLDKIPPYHSKYVTNPFRFQYDLTMFIWINFDNIIKEESKILRKLAKNNKSFDDEADKMISTRTLYGISRTDFLFAAGNLRWPTTVDSDGSCRGLFIRDPWSERRINALSDPVYKYVIGFGGGGQGKTLVSLAFNLMIFDYFIFTQKGARCMISTVNKDKLNSVSWSYLCNLNSSTMQEMSLYAGKAKIAGDHTLVRPENKDRGGVFKGILIGNQMNDQTIIDKLTGSHGHPFISYIVDEAQSTPDPPIMAAPNYTMHAKDFRIQLAGNWGSNHDTLAQNVKPDLGWESVDETTGRWISTTQNGSKAICLHFNNNLSPGMEDDGHKKFPHLPHKGILERNYPNPSTRNPSNISYRRFWVGFRVEDLDDTVVISDNIIKENLAHLPLNLDKVTHSFFSFDSAPAEIDRNLQVIFNEGVCSVTKQRVFGPRMIYALKKATESLKYYRESSKQLLDNANKHLIKSGAGIVDWTGRPAHPENLMEMGFYVHKIIYNKAVPDGVRKDRHTGRTEKHIRLNVQLDFKNDMPAEKVCAHHVAENMISLGAWALREYVKAGRVRGINDQLLQYLQDGRTLEEELYHRKFRYKTSTAHGDRFHLESKDDFKSLYGFSPDLLDCLFEGALYMLIYRSLPLTPINTHDIVEDVDDAVEKDSMEHLEIWDEDSISDLI